MSIACDQSDSNKFFESMHSNLWSCHVRVIGDLSFSNCKLMTARNFSCGHSLVVVFFISPLCQFDRVWVRIELQRTSAVHHLFIGHDNFD